MKVELSDLIFNVENRAFMGCGLSDVLWESRVQSGYASILASALEAERAEVLKALMDRGFDPDFVSYEAGEGECELTGIDTDHCPCGRHP